VTLLVVAAFAFAAVAASLLLAFAWSLRRTLGKPLPIRLAAEADSQQNGIWLRITPTRVVRGLTIESIRISRELVDVCKLQPPPGFTPSSYSVPSREHFEADAGALDVVAGPESFDTSPMPPPSLADRIARADDEQYAEATAAARAFNDQWVVYEGRLRVPATIEILMPGGPGVLARGGRIGVTFAYRVGLHRVQGGTEAAIASAEGSRPGPASPAP
jgi:hypothetical protein